MFEAGTSYVSMVSAATQLGEANSAAFTFLKETERKYPNGELPRDRAELLQDIDRMSLWLHLSIDSDLRSEISARYQHLAYVLPLLSYIDYDTHLAGKKLSIADLSEIWEIHTMLKRLESGPSSVELCLEIFRTRFVQLGQRAAATQSDEDILALINSMVTGGEAASSKELRPKE